LAAFKWHRKRPFLKYLAYLLWALFFIGVISVVITFMNISKADLPTFEDLENPKYDLASLVLDRNGEQFGKYYIENREQVDFDEISPNILNALLATEDSRYFSHSGIDVRALVRVAFKTVLLRQQSSGGGSTITQQLAKLLFNRASLRGKSSFGRMMALISIKLKEWITSVKLEKSYTKEEIMAMYLNKFEFINGAHGIEAAAEVYFGKNQEDLSVEEAATLVGMLQNPVKYNPVRFPEKSAERRNIVLEQMRKKRHLDKVAYDSLIVKPIDLSNFKRSSQSEGLAPYFRSELTKWLKKKLEEPRYSKVDGTKYNIYTDGLKIHTTIDLRYQQLAEESVFQHMRWNQNRYWDRWRNQNPLTFEADSLQLILRQESVDRRIHYSERYQNLFKTVFTALNQTADKEYNGFQFTEPALRRIFKAENYQSGVRSFENNNLRATYQDIIGKSIWKDVKDQWKSFRAQYDEIFNTKMTMKVFDYDEGEIEKEMTPLDSVKFHMRHLQAGTLVAEAKTGNILAWVGGINHKYFKYDHVNSRRQVGSTIKPFVYATAISIQGISPCQEFEDIQYTVAPGDVGLYVDEEWSPANANGEFTGNKYNLYQGLLYSKNSITVRLIKEMGSVEVIRDLLNNVGIDKEARYPNGRLVVPAIPSLCLGSVDLSVFEMTGAYTSFVNNGVYTEPVFIDYIEDKNGRIIYRSTPNQKRALNPLYNSVIVDMLQNNTGGRFGMGIKSQNGGKTGTTNDYADSWFMGITPNLVVGTWVGGDEKWVRFYNLDDGQGFVNARPIFQDFMKRLEAADSTGYDANATFIKPPEGYSDFVDCDRYKQVEPEVERQQTLDQQILTDEFEEEFEEGFEEFDEEPIDTSGIRNF